VNPEKSYPLQYKGLIGIIIGQCLAFVEETFCRFMVKNKLIFTVGCELFNKYRKFSKKTFVSYTNIISTRQIHNNFEIPSEISVLKILYVGRFVPQKGLINLLVALKILISEGYLIKLNLVGDGICKNEMEDYVQKNNLKGHVKFWGKN
jgi:glycosyltransferase involved in cell wall biosynthesis